MEKGRNRRKLLEWAESAGKTNLEKVSKIVILSLADPPISNNFLKLHLPLPSSLFLSCPLGFASDGFTHDLSLIHTFRCQYFMDNISKISLKLGICCHICPLSFKMYHFHPHPPPNFTKKKKMTIFLELSTIEIPSS